MRPDPLLGSNQRGPSMRKEKRKRKRTPTATEDEVLFESTRRCCLCFHLDHNFDSQRGGIHHIDEDPSNSEKDNLVFLCERHTDLVHTKSTRSKRITPGEVKRAREKLYRKLKELQEQEGQSLLSTSSGRMPSGRRGSRGSKRSGGRARLLLRIAGTWRLFYDRRGKTRSQVVTIDNSARMCVVRSGKAELCYVLKRVQYQPRTRVVKWVKEPIGWPDHPVGRGRPQGEELALSADNNLMQGRALTDGHRLEYHRLSRGPSQM